jgi:hypothetical protein
MNIIVKYVSIMVDAFRPNQYILKKTTQIDLVDGFRELIPENLFSCMKGTNLVDCKTILKSDLASELKKLATMVDQSTIEMEKYDELLKKRNVSLFAALVQAHDPSIVQHIYEELRQMVEDKQRVNVPEWKEYLKESYTSFFKELKKTLPNDDHQAFYTKSVSRTSEHPKKTPADSPQPQREKKSPRKANTTGPDLLEKANKLSRLKNKNDDNNRVINNGSSKNSPSPNPVPKSSTKVSVKPIQAPIRPQLKREQVVETPQSTNSSEKECSQQPPLKKSEQTNQEEVNLVKEVIIPEEKKPQLTLLEKMQKLAKSAARDPEMPSPKKSQIPYPIVFTNKSWLRLWSNSKGRIGEGWKGKTWNTNSIGKAYLMRDKKRKNITQELDVNQDIVFVNKTKKGISVLMFDGVSQSRAPREWAEFLAQVYVEMKLSIRDLEVGSARLEEWHNTAVERWENWIETEYLPKRGHLPAWRLEKEVKSSFTTFVALEIGAEKIKMANIGDSAIFAKFKSGEVTHLPSKYNHLLRPKNISTEKLFTLEEMEFLTLDTDDVESLLACTDSIADYIFDEEMDALQRKLESTLGYLSKPGDKFNFMSKMISIGPSNGGWLEDDVSFFSLVPTVNLGGEEE